jgi:hypothetical protein
MESHFRYRDFYGAVIASTVLADPEPTQIHPNLASELAGYGITDYQHFIPVEIMNWRNIFTRLVLSCWYWVVFWLDSVRDTPGDVPVATPSWAWLHYNGPL